MFVLNSEVTIGKFRFSGVNDVFIARSIHSINDTALIKIPSFAKIIKNENSIPGSIKTEEQFKEGDPVVIKLGYNNDLQTEFSGFVKRKNLTMPLEVECEGYSWLLRRNSVSKFFETISIKELLEEAISGIDSKYKIKVICTADIVLNNISIDNLSGFDIINNISRYTDNNLSCFFIQPDTLWCGYVYTSYGNGTKAFEGAQKVSYKLGYNALKANTLKTRTTETDRIEVRYSKKLPDGNSISERSDAFKKFARTHSKVLNQIRSAPALKQLANEKAYRENFEGYEGAITAFLQPYSIPGYSAYITDDQYSAYNDTYLIESVQVSFGVTGARRIIEIGPRLGFAK